MLSRLISDYRGAAKTRTRELLVMLGVGPVGRGAALSLMIQLVMLAFGFAQSILLARLLGASSYGAYSVVLSVAVVVASLGLMGLGEFAVREVSRLNAHKAFELLKGFVVFSFIGVLTATLAGGIVVAAWVGSLQTAPYGELGWCVLLAPFMALLMLLRGVSQGFGSVLSTQLPTEVIRPGTMLMLLVIAWLVGANLNASAGLAMFCVANVIGLAVAVGMLKSSQNARFAHQPALFEVRAWLKGALPFFGLGLLMTAQVEINTLLLGWLAGPREAGLFQPLQRLAPIMLLAMQAISIPLAPRVSELWEVRDIQLLNQTIRRSNIASMVLATVTIGAILIFGFQILSAFGAEFTVNVAALWWIGAAQLINVACGPVAIILNMTGHQTVAFKGLLGGVLVNLLGGILLVPIYGAHGAAIAFSLSTVVWNILMLRAVKRRLNLEGSLLFSLFTKRTQASTS